MGLTRRQVFDLIDAERERQIIKHGPQDGNSDERWFAILGEEVGEVAEVVVDTPFTGTSPALLNELVHVAAVAVSWLEKRGR